MLKPCLCGGYTEGDTGWRHTRVLKPCVWGGDTVGDTGWTHTRVSKPCQRMDDLRQILETQEGARVGHTPMCLTVWHDRRKKMETYMF